MILPSEFISVKDASVLLNKAPRTVYRMIKKRQLSRRTHGGRVVLLLQEVQDFSVCSDSFHRVVNPENFNRLSLRVKRAESNLMLVNRVLELRRDPIRLPDHELALLYQGCLGMITENSFEFKELQNWSDIFLRVDDWFFQKLRSLTGDESPTAKFYALAKKMLGSVRAAKGFKTSVELQAAADLLDKSRRQLLAQVSFELELGQTLTFTDRLNGLIGGRAEELDRLATVI